jgi:hypothetical protein
MKKMNKNHKIIAIFLLLLAIAVPSSFFIGTSSNSNASANVNTSTILKQAIQPPSLNDAQTQWYDRNPTVVFNAYNQIVPNGAWTDRQQWTYTVPKNREFFLEYLVVTLNAQKAAASGDTIVTYVTYTPNGAASQPLIKLTDISTTTQLAQTQQIGQSILLLPGDTISAYTTMPNEVNTVQFSITMKGTEFSA